MQRLQASEVRNDADGRSEAPDATFRGLVFNRALALQQRYEAGEEKLGYAGLCKELTGWRNDANTVWLKESPIHPLQQALKDLERAETNFFAKRSVSPRFKKKGPGDSVRCPASKQIKTVSAIPDATICINSPRR
ncbi:hypothetical protein [Guyparkeria sp.]|uniref:hypothetical protein n=1 Tax=Guyparkeria sp. TaxID=2035736 RepID=UPI003970D69D